MSESKDYRVLSIQSHVVSGYVGNKSACFPLQVLGFDVDAINSVQFSNHTGYKHFKGQILNCSELKDLVEGLRLNNLLNYSHILTGYVGDPSFLKEVSSVIKELKEINPDLVYVCDPVMGDQGQMYVPQECLAIYQNEVVTNADILTPNQYEAELLTGISIKNEADAFKAIDLLHNKGIGIVVLTSTNFETTAGNLVGLASCRKGGDPLRLRLEMPLYDAIFTGTGDLFAATFLAWMSKSDNNLKMACEQTINTVQAILKRTFEYATGKSEDKSLSRANLELRLVQSRDDIVSPNDNFNVRVTEL